jgi:hypothetical protein
LQGVGDYDWQKAFPLVNCFISVAIPGKLLNLARSNILPSKLPDDYTDFGKKPSLYFA